MIRSHIFTELNGLKGLAALVIITFHVVGGMLLTEKYDSFPIFHYAVGPILTCGWFAVDIFFVLSSFFITFRYVNDSGSKMEWLQRRYSKFFPYIWLGVIPNYILSFIAPNMGLLGFVLLILITAIFIRIVKGHSVIQKNSKKIFFSILVLQVAGVCVNIFDGWYNFSANQTFDIANSFLINILVIQPFSRYGDPVIFWTIFPLLTFYFVFVLILRPFSLRLKRLSFLHVFLINILIIIFLIYTSFLFQGSYFNIRLNQFFRQYCFFVGFQLALYWDKIVRIYNRFKPEILVFSTLHLYLFMLLIYIGITPEMFIFTSVISAFIAACMIMNVLQYSGLRRVFNLKALRFVGAQAYGILLFQSPIYNFSKEFVVTSGNVPEYFLLVIVPVVTCLVSWAALRIIDVRT